MSSKNLLIVIVGPTASGKSELAVKLARKFSARGGPPPKADAPQEQASGWNGAEIISADSRQVYRGLDIGTGKVPRDKNPKSEIRNPKQILNSKFQIPNSYYHKGVRHHLIDVASPKRTFTVAQYQKLAQKAIKDILKRGKLPIICGGTGFYISAVVDGLVIPEVRPNLTLRQKLERKSTKELFTILKSKDPRRAKTIDQYNRRRLTRALEIITAIGQVPPLTHNSELITNNILIIGIKKDNEILKRLIKKRLLQRLKQGLITEVKNLHKGGLSWKRLEQLGLEYRYVAQYLQQLARTDALRPRAQGRETDKTRTDPSTRAKLGTGHSAEKEMMDILSKEIWHYARRQITWFKKDKRIYWIKTFKEAGALIYSFLRQNRHC